MNFDRAQGLQALSYLVMAFFVAGGVVSGRWRRRMKWAAIALYGAGVALALVWVGVWFFGIQG
ncbi:MAG TPA: hypothetical protein VGG57_05115 [Stellaceae bacterium]|jgi:hypothetical protein